MNSDITIICADCGQEFVWSVGEQKYYFERGFASPKRCKACRDKRKADKNN